ncbi:MAG: ABC transporter permease [Pseudochelatococcus sp.]|jgi:peptide/nickel transport system permease protein|uniref:ABC transporter permease n=1 Tax=Pseudochelatococcus sp. TaxID=2020869 RepID=UPI003D8B1DF6
MIRRHLVSSLLQMLPVLYIVSLIVFILVYLTGDPVALMLPEDEYGEEARRQLIEALGLDQPWYVQYYIYMRNILTGDFGISYRYGSSALPVVLERIPATLELTLGALAVSIVISVPLGILSARYRNSFVDIGATALSVAGKAMPNFWIGIMLILVFSVMLRWVPVSGRGGMEHLVLPALTLGTGLAAEMTKMIRASLIEVMSQDYIRTARAKGLSEFAVVWRHGLRNSLIPVTTITSLNVVGLLGGALVTETVFAWPGIGQLIVQAVYTKDMAVVQVSVFIIGVMAMLLSIATDLIYHALDPRIRYSR